MKKGNNIYKRKNGRWEARYPRTRANGQIQYGYCYGKTYAEALKKRREMEELIEMGIETKPIRAKTVADLCDQWLRHKALHVKPASYDKYVYSINAHIRADLGPVSIQALDDEHIDRFTAGLFDKGLRVKTIRDILSILNSILAYAAKRFPRLRRIQIVFPRDDKAPARVLSEEEQTRLIEYLRADLDPCKFGTLLALMTGMRIGEICALQWKDISLADSLLVVSNTMIRLRGHPEESKKTKVVISTPKSAASTRIIPLNRPLRSLCAMCRPDDPEAYVLTGCAERYMEPRTLQNYFKRYLRDCGMDGIHFHTLRHTFATRCVEAGVEIKALSEILGHASCQITWDTYVHLSMDAKRQNLDRLEDKLNL